MIVSGIALGHAPARLAVAGDRPALEAGRVQPPEDPRPAFDEGFDLEVVLPHAAVAQVCGEAGDEQVGGLEDVTVGRDDKGLVRHVLSHSSVHRRRPAQLRDREAPPKG